jgi:hypothetical protein
VGELLLGSCRWGAAAGKLLLGSCCWGAAAGALCGAAVGEVLLDLMLGGGCRRGVGVGELQQGRRGEGGGRRATKKKRRRLDNHF